MKSNMKNALCFILLSLLCLSVKAQYHGKVFVDSNQNGLYDVGEKTLKEVLVSDGLNVTTTSSQGEYLLTGHAKEKFIFITTPSGYKTNNAYYKRIQPSVNQYDFGVLPCNGAVEKDGTHRFIHLSDTEIRETSGHDDWVSNLRDYATNEKMAFIIHTGDICYVPGLESHIKLMNTANMNTPVFYCLGNHDLVEGPSGEDLFEKLYGPTYYSFEVGNIHYIVTPMPNGDHKPSYTTEDIYRWLKNDLSKIGHNKSIVMFNHGILDQTDLFHFGINSTDYIDLKKHHLKAWLYGHWHINHILKHAESGIYSICTSTPIRGGIDHASSAFRVIKMDGKGDLNSELRYTYLDKSIQIASIANLHSPALPTHKIPLSVNTYSTVSPTTKVSYTCYYHDRPLFKDRLMKQQTDFNWYADFSLPLKYKGKSITLSVTAHFNNGEKAKATESFIYQPTIEEKIQTDRPSTNLLASPTHISLNNETLSPPLKLCWVNNVGSNIYMTSPLIYKDRIYVASIDENNSGKAAVICLDAATGKMVWKHPTKGSIKNSIALSAETVLAQDIYGNLYAMNAKDGKLKWEKKLHLNAVPALNDGLIATDHVVYAGTGQGLCAINIDRGETLWTNQSWNQGEGCTATLSLNNNVLIGHAHWGALYANNATNGELLWKHSENGLRHRSSSAAMLGSVMYILSDQSLFIIESATGNILVRKPLGYNVNVTSTPLITDKEIIFGTADRGLMALDKETLMEKWNFKTRPAMIYSAPYVRNPASTIETSPILCGTTVYIASSDGYLYGLEQSTGRLLWQYNTGSPCFSTLSTSGNALFAADFSGNVYAFTPSVSH